MIFGKEVTLKEYGKDKYGRTIADVLSPDGTNVNQQLVKEGWCWWYQKHAPKDLPSGLLKGEAKEAQRGLWSDSDPVPPMVVSSIALWCISIASTSLLKQSPVQSSCILQ